jgi:hypothetical protein
MELELTQAENFILSVTDSQARIDLKRFANEIRSAANDSIELNKIRDRLDGWGSRRTQ